MSVTIAEITVGDEPASWAAAGFTVDGDVVQIGTVRIRCAGRADGKRIRSWSLAGLPTEHRDLTELDGLNTTGGEPSTDPPPTHPNGATQIDHIVVLTPDTGRTTAVFDDIGWEAKRVRTVETYGPPMLQTFFRAGEVIVELVGPPEPMGDGPAGFYGLAHTVTDLDATAALLGEHLGPIKDAVQPGRRIATLRHKALDMSVATALLSD